MPEALLSDRGTNLLSHLVLDLCGMLGIKKLNTTSYHPQCDGIVERFNRTLKTMIRKHAARFGNEWDQYLSGILWSYRNTPHSSTGEKPSFLLFGVDCRSPTEAAFMPTSRLQPTDIVDYREELMLTCRLPENLLQSAFDVHRVVTRTSTTGRPPDLSIGLVSGSLYDSHKRRQDDFGSYPDLGTAHTGLWLVMIQTLL